MEIKNLAKHVVGCLVIKKEYQDKKPQQIFVTYEEFSKRWRDFLKGSTIEKMITSII